MKRAMTSRERVLTAIHHQEPDRVPFNYYGNPGIDRRLREHFGKDDILEALGVDFRSVGAPYIGKPTHQKNGDIIVDEWGIRQRWVRNEYGGFWEYCDWPLRDADIEAIEAWAFPNPDDYDYASVRDACNRHQKHCICAGGAGIPDVINSCSFLRTMEQVLLDLITDNEAGLRLIERRNSILMEITRRTLEAGSGKIDMLCLGEDLGTQRGPTISIELFRKHIRPRIQGFVDLARSFNIPTMFHSCGSSSWAFDDFIEIGINVVETLQPEALNMSPRYLKSRYGGRLAFHGCISTAGPLAYGSRQDVIRTVRETLDIMMPGGGYILSPTHLVQDNTPAENVLALYDAGRTYGVYAV